jgi:hypothetical protein
MEQVGLKTILSRPALFSLSFEKFFKKILIFLSLYYIIRAFKELNDDIVQDKKASTAILN